MSPVTSVCFNSGLPATIIETSTCSSAPPDSEPAQGCSLEKLLDHNDPSVTRDSHEHAFAAAAVMAAGMNDIAQIALNYGEE